MASLLRSWGLVLMMLMATITVDASPRPNGLSKRDFKVLIDTDAQLEPALPASFADPSIIRGDDGIWYAFATNSGGVHVPMAHTRDPLGKWTRLAQDAMPDLGWTSGKDFWAPDVRQLPDGSYIMYFSGRVPGDKHCIGVARSESVTGPYKPDPQPLICPLNRGGAIDPSGFYDEATEKRYITYKVDGNAMGHGGSCGNSVAPIVDTPLMLQQVDNDDGSTLIGAPRPILHLRKEDGPVIEAPNIVKIDCKYVLFFSSGCFDGNGYKTKYAYASKPEGPYVRAGETLLESPDLGLAGPGGATSTEDGKLILALHGYCDGGRCMYVVPYDVQQ